MTLEYERSLKRRRAYAAFYHVYDAAQDAHTFFTNDDAMHRAKTRRARFLPRGSRLLFLREKLSPPPPRSDPFLIPKLKRNDDPE